MSVLVDTTQLPPRERFDAWASAGLQVFEPISVTPRTDRPFAGKLVRHELGPVQLLHLAADASAACRTTRLITSSDPENVELMLQLRGCCQITQEDRCAAIDVGDLGSWHSSAPYVVASDRPFGILIVTCPASMLGRDADRFRRRTAERIDGSGGLGGVVGRHLRALGDALAADGCPQAARNHLAEGLFDLIRALNAPAAPAVRVGVGRGDAHALRMQIDRYIDANLSDPQLSRDQIARAHFVSRSRLDRLYGGEGRGVWGTIRERRLDRVRRDLADPTLANESVFAIGCHWGFVSPSHLSRAFRDAYGVTPSAHRVAALRSAAVNGD